MFLANKHRWWYGPILPFENSFPFACRQTLTKFLNAVSSHLSRKRPADTFLNFITNTTSIFIVFLSELSSALMTPGFSDLGVSDAIHSYLEENQDSNLANVLNLDQQKKKLTAVAEDILHKFLDPAAFNCDPVRIFLREILAGVILETTMKSCAKPEWINEWIIYLLEEGEPEIMNAIDAGVEGTSVKEIKNASAQQELNNYSAQSNNIQGTPMSENQSTSSHQRKISKAEDAMEQAMLEAKRLTELIASEDAKKNHELEGTASSENPTGVTVTPTSSQSDIHAFHGLRPLPEEMNEAPAKSPPQITSEEHRSFTTFDQILALDQSTAPHSSESPLRSPGPPPLTLHSANISIFDDAQPGEKANIRSKPTVEYLLQIEPASSQHPGWMIARKYADFETLHEVLRRISVVSGVAAFANQHNTIPTWKNKTKASLRTDLEKYLRDALSYRRLAESEGMKRFLEKDQGLGRSTTGTNKGLLGFPSPAAFETMGKGMLDVLASAPKGAAGGGKALLDGVSGVFGGQKKPNLPARPTTSRSGSVSSMHRTQDHAINSAAPSVSQSEASQESLRHPVLTPMEASRVPPLPKRPETGDLSVHGRSDLTTTSSNGIALPESKSLTELSTGKMSNANESLTEQSLHLPPLPSEIPDDYASVVDSPRTSLSISDANTHRSSISTAPPSIKSPSRKDLTSTASLENSSEPLGPPKRAKPSTKAQIPLTEEETRVAVELFFAVINELYTLSSAWNIRKTLLNAAKTFLLRPGNPNLEAIRVLLQDSMITANTSDTGLALHLSKLRENSLPTEEELASWPPPPSDEEKERLRVKARRLLIERGMPQALTSVMGAYASGEALGRVFDSLQIEEVARGLVFALLLQGVRAITQ